MGKSTISQYLANKHNLPILDADLYARDAVETGSPVLHEIVERYGSSILQPDGRLDRARLGEIIFASPAERLWLEQRIHPYVRDRMEQNLQQLNQQNCQMAVLVVPLLFEARMTDLVTEIWVVRCSADQQIQRIQQRDHLKLEQIQARINSQMPIDRKIQQADFVLDNSSTTKALLQQVDEALTRKKV